MNAIDYILVFLDLDGVLHHWFPRAEKSDEQNKHFAYLPRLEAVIRGYPSIRIVISSDWRFTGSLDELRAYFGDDIRQLVIGMTRPVRAPKGTHAPRQREIEEFLREHNLEGVRWLALDDHAANFEADAPLIVCNDEFGDREEAMLRMALNEWLSRDPAGGAEP